MLSKSNRLRLKNDFKRVFEKGKSFRQNCILLKAIKNDLGKTRFGFIVSKKVLKKAAQRNKVKRRLRQITREELKRSAIKNGFDAVLVALPGIEKMDFPKIKNTTQKLLKRSNLIK